MADCECLPKCPFFNNKMFDMMPAMIDILKTKYCQGEFSSCARYMVFKARGREAVPVDLYPNQIERVAQILNA